MTCEYVTQRSNTHALRLCSFAPSLCAVFARTSHANSLAATVYTTNCAHYALPHSLVHRCACTHAHGVCAQCENDRVCNACMHARTDSECRDHPTSSVSPTAPHAQHHPRALQQHARGHHNKHTPAIQQRTLRRQCINCVRARVVVRRATHRVDALRIH